MSTTKYQDPYAPGGVWHEWAESLPPDRAAYYRSEKWRSTRRARRYFDGYRCVVCGSWDQGKLVCHHISYENFGDEPMEDLRTVCVDCHENASEEELEQEQKRLPIWLVPGVPGDVVDSAWQQHKNRWREGKLADPTPESDEQRDSMRWEEGEERDSMSYSQWIGDARTLQDVFDGVDTYEAGIP